MTRGRVKSRKKWEQELLNRHHATTPVQPKLVSMGKFLLGDALIAAAIAVFSYTHSMLAGLVAVPGIYLVITAVHWNALHK
jgi:hypothetical protein